MTERKAPSDWSEEFRFFLDTDGSTPPKILASKVKGSVLTDLNPAFWIVSLKLLAIHFVSGAATLLVCPQFGWSFKGETRFLVELFNGLGEHGCLFACGALFMGATGLISALLLRPQDVRAIRASRGLQWVLLALFSAGVLLSFFEQEASIAQGLVVAWLLGAVTSGAGLFQLVSYLRRRWRSRPRWQP